MIIPRMSDWSRAVWMCRLFLAAGVLVSSVSCQSMQRPAFQEQGWASYIADSYAGKPTSSGAFYDPRAFTAAHNTLPFGTMVTVKNQQNGKKVEVMVNDRFPRYPGRVINVSGVAGMAIGIPPFQLAPVEVTAKEFGPPGSGAGATPAYSPGYGGAGAGAPAYGAAPPPAMGAYNTGAPPPTYTPPPTYGAPANPGYLPDFNSTPAPYTPPAGGGIPPAGGGLAYPPGGDRGL